jgi:hypothetical protein
MHLFITHEGVSVQRHHLPTPAALIFDAIGPDQHSIIPPSFAHVFAARAAVAAHRLGTGDDSSLATFKGIDCVDDPVITPLLATHIVEHSWLSGYVVNL